MPKMLKLKVFLTRYIRIWLDFRRERDHNLLIIKMVRRLHDTIILESLESTKNETGSALIHQEQLLKNTVNRCKPPRARGIVV